jgi:membrane-anchored protein YejM (alkaline phosphatase superfamily)
MDYIKLDLRDNIQGIHARYINAAHHIDQQVGRLLDYLQAHQMLNDTIVLFSGDHGEEFMEKGRWGHGTGNAFPEEQIRVPLVLWLPGHAPQVIRYRTSHLQISPTLLETLGVTAPAHDYCSAVSLFTPLTSGFVLGEFDHMGLIVDGKYKISFPYTGSSFFHYTVFDINDHLVSREENARVVAQAKPELDKLIAESRRFVR